MDTKMIKIMTKLFYEPWNQVEHVTKFAQRLNEQQVYLNGHDGHRHHQLERVAVLHREKARQRLLRQTRHYDVAEYITITGGLEYVHLDNNKPSLTPPESGVPTASPGRKNARQHEARIVPPGTR